MTVAIFTPTRHPGIAVSAHGVRRQDTNQDIIWLVADTLHRDFLYEWGVSEGIYTTCNFEPVRGWNEKSSDRVSNLAAMSNWALREARKYQVDLLIFLQDFIWMPPDGLEKFLADAQTHPFALLTGAVDAANAYPFGVVDADDPWDIFDGKSDQKPWEPYELDTRLQFGMPPGLVTNHAWEINYGALPYALINAGVDFDEDYDYGTQWENTQFSFDIARKFARPENRIAGQHAGYVWWNPDNRAIALPHREYFPATHAGERAVRNDERFWSKNPDLIGR